MKTKIRLGPSKRTHIINLSFLFVCTFTLITSLLLLTGCGGASKSEAVDYAYMETVAATTAAASYSTNAMPGSSVTAYSEAFDAEEAEIDTCSGLGNSTGITPTETIGRKLIRTIYLSVETDDFDTLLATLQDKIAALSGYIEQSDISGTSINSDTRHSRRRAYMTVRIPGTSLDQFVLSVEDNGNVTNKSETTNDVTLQYSDLESRKKTLSLEQDRIWALLEKADTLEAIIALEERLSEIRYELESMESKIRLYDNQVEYSTIHIDIEEVKIYTPVEPESVGQRIQNGFTRNIENMKEFSIDLFVLLVSFSPIWIPMLCIGLIVVFSIKRRTAGKNISKMISAIPVSFEEEKDGSSSSSYPDPHNKN